MNSTAELPYELHTHGSGAFVIFNTADQIALPLIALGRATLHEAQNGDEIVLEFVSVEVAIKGRGRAPLLDHLVTGRVKRVSCAVDAACDVVSIRFMETR